MDTFKRGSACSRNHPTSACPASWYETTFFSSCDIRDLDFGSPPITRSTARSKSTIATLSLLRRAAKMAASLQMFAMSAPDIPGVREDIRLATSSEVSSLASFRGLRWTPKISSRPSKSGLSIVMLLSNRPGRVRALSRMSALFVPARTTTPVEDLNPSISTNIWFKVFSLSSFPPANPPLFLFLPTASISSIKIIDGACLRAC
mmetsp:Transcript_1503/g.3139  ORF Transcript_1503/g.3139 Transcript_1503/m.3139 type:complete len:204 (-) Transcript_1503:815-1426(-)